MTSKNCGWHFGECSDWKLRAGFRALHRTQLTRQETGYPYLIKSFPERHSFGRTNDGTGSGVYGKIRLREPALYSLAARRHRPQTHAHRFGTYQRERRKDRPQPGGHPGTEHLSGNGSEVRASSHARRTWRKGTTIPAKSGLSERWRKSTGKAYRPYLVGMLQLPFACRIQYSFELL